MTDKKKALLAVRDEIDSIDEQIQDLLIRRTKVVEKVRTIKDTARRLKSVPPGKPR